MIVNSHAVRYFTSDSPPDTRGLSSMLKLNNITVGKLIDIKEDEDNEKKATRIEELFMYDGLGEIYRLTSDKKNLYDSPWSDPSSELLLKKGKNYILCENLNQIHISDSSNSKIETTNLSKGEINSKNYSEILKEKFVEIKKQATILKILNSSESNKELKTLITNIETFEKQITGSSNNKYYLCEQIKKIEEVIFKNKVQMN